MALNVHDCVMEWLATVCRSKTLRQVYLDLACPGWHGLYDVKRLPLYSNQWFEAGRTAHQQKNDA
jgi:hypothetical protein